MYRSTLYLLFFFFANLLRAQAPFTEKLYAWQVEKNLVYGTAVNYLGLTDTLTLDLYKPLNADTARPLLVLVHGGSWLGGCKEDMAWFCEEMAARGYAAATVNYRKGWHKDDVVSNPINPGVFAGGNSLYAADSLEIIRAIYRGMQDVKGAIRWLKARVYADSTCNHAVLVGGESAGAFVALAVGMLDRPIEKPAACGPLPAAPVPGSNLANSFTVNCIFQTPPLPPDALARPDLGSIDGALNQNGYDASVIGVISFYGGVPAQAFADNWLEGPNNPALYLYHQTCDGIVPFQYGKPMFVISAYCNLGFTPWHNNLPFVFGNGAIATKVTALPSPPPMLTEFFNCNNFDPNFAFFECIRFNENGSYHWVINRPERAEKIAGFFSPVVAAKLATPPCLVGTGEPRWAAGLRLAPNPFEHTPPTIFSDEPLEAVRLRVLDQHGRLLWQEPRDLSAGANPLRWDAAAPPGWYYLQVSDREGAAVWKMVKR